MSTPVATFKNILSAIEQTPALLDAMRRHVRGEELLQLPTIATETVQAVQEWNAAANTVNERLDHVEHDVADLNGQAKMQGHLSDLTGSDYERKATKRARHIARAQLHIPNALPIHAVTMPNATSLPKILEVSAERGAITDGQAEKAKEADLVIS